MAMHSRIGRVALTFMAGIVFGLALRGGVAAGEDGAQRIKELDTQFDRITGTGDTDGVRKLLDPHAVFFSNEPLSGPDAIVAAWAPIIGEGHPTLEWAPDRAEILPGGGIGFTTGGYRSVSLDADGEARVSTGRYFTLWRKRGNDWKLLVDVDTSPLPE